MTLLYLGIANGMLSLVIAKSKFFEWFRDYLFNRGREFLHELFSCPYCLSHWVAIMLTLAVPQTRVIHIATEGCRASIACTLFTPLDFLVTMFVQVAIATATWTITFGLMNWAEKE